MTQVTDNIAKLSDILHKGKEGNSVYYPEFQHILDEVHLALDRQDSDGALTAIIR